MDQHHQNDEAARRTRTSPDEDTRPPDERRRRGFPAGLRRVFMAVVLGVGLYRHFQGAG